MAWTNISFTFGTKLEAAKLNQLQANFTALADNATGSPTFTGRATGIVTFAADGAIHKAVGISSITHGATGQYILNMSATFSVGLQVTSTANTTKRSVPSTVMLGFNKNVAYSDVSVRALNGANALRANSGTFQLRFNAMNNSAQALEDVTMGHAIFIDNVE
tara:strand:- start:2237 stop:2722 length:486 start_codon:yes stop_codon:yes gene_type:complete